MAIVAAGALIAGAIYFGGAHGTAALAGKANTAAAVAVGTIEPVTAKDHLRGDPNAKVTI